jgi:hypothetical protein
VRGKPHLRLKICDFLSEFVSIRLDKIRSEDLMISFENIKKNIHKSHRERGQAIVLVAVGMIALIAVIGLATDAAMIYKTKQDLQRSVDSAALAGAYKLPKKAVAIQATTEFMRLHGYNNTPCGTDPLLTPCDTTQPYLDISFPNEAVQKIVHVEASTDASYFFLRILGFNKMTVKATGEGEAAPMDVYLILDLSESMTYDTFNIGAPNPWPSGFPKCPYGSWAYQSDCVAQYCNWAKGNPDAVPPVPPKDSNRICDPLDNNLKPAAKFFIDQLDARYDRVGLVTYTITGTLVIPLTSNFNAVKIAIDNLSAFDRQEKDTSDCPIYNGGSHQCNKQTNIGDGIMVAHNNIALPYDPVTKTGGGRMDSIWSMVLETDGKANVYRSCSGCPPSCGAIACQTIYSCDECPNAINWALNNAQDTWTRHETTIYTIAYGTTSNDPAYQDTLIKIAAATDGVPGSATDNFFAAPNGSALRNAFLIIAERIYSRLLK